MARIVRLTESDLTRLVKRVIREMDSDIPRKSRGIMGHKDSWFDDMDRPTNPDEFEHEEEIEFGPNDYDEYLKHTSDIENKWPFVPDTESERRGYGNRGKSYFDRYTKEGPVKLRKRRSMEEGVIQERKEDTMGEEGLKKILDKYADEIKKAHSMSTTDLEIILDELTRLSKMIQKNKKLDTYERFELKKEIHFIKKDIQDEIDNKVDKDR